MYTRRDFAKMAVASLPLASLAGAQTRAKFSSKINGVQIGAITYCYRSLRDNTEPYSPSSMERLIDRVVDAYVQNGIDCARVLDCYDRTTERGLCQPN